ncbi:hypothetical protein [Anaeromyxobacter diazotrophicus]|uniref:Uncharacterized protein n=1 Tax=Anaeromyxobacter diazotrophicus TaxID=2590199 RepID=A0A7I9VGR7_9BACT|nr:hypothetical protein [Anaeromyxobacter diazotrophicus]GEJ55535.1 hypothetical protein AMYX_02760 [Anaeromyxobacter diazotrophicus]
MTPGPLWSLEARSETARAVAAAAYLVAVALLVVLQELGVRLRREEARAWWAGNGRDLLNALGLAAVAAALRAYGFPLPAALATGGTLTLALFGTSVFMDRQDRIVRRRAWALLAALALAAPVLLFPGQLLALLGEVARRLFPLVG